MKKLLLLSFFAFGVFLSNAQVCTPDPSCPSGICPDTVANLPDAYINVLYDTAMTIVVPDDTTFSLQGQQATFKFDSVIFENWDLPGDINLPPGINVYCDNPNNLNEPCAFYGNTLDCMKLTGTVTTMADTGVWDLVVKTRAYLTCMSPSFICGFVPKLDTAIIFEGYHLEVKCIGVNAVGSNGSATANVTGQSGLTYTYNWSNGATTQTATGLSAGVHTVTVTASNGCTDVDTATVTGGSSIFENYSDIFEVRQNVPNPFSGITNISFNTNKSGKVVFKVYNILGEVIHSENIISSVNQNTIQFDGSELPSGVYSYSLDNGGRVITKRMTVSAEN